MRSALLAAVAGLTLGAGTAHATITITTGNTPQPSEQNIMFESGDLTPALMQTGDTNKSNSPAIFDSNFAKATGSLGGAGTSQLFNADGIGQANLVCADTPAKCPNAAGGLTNLLTSMEMRPGAGLGWGDALLNLDSGIGTVNLFVADQMGGQFDFKLKKGENKFTIVASAGEVITDIQVSELATATGAFGWDKFKQPRVSGVCTLNADKTCTPIPIPVPEPAGIAAFGVGLCGLLLARRAYKARSPTI